MNTTPRMGVRVENLTWTPFGSAEPLLRNLSFRIQPGERVLLIGPSGSGKSTLLRAIANVLEQTESGELAGLVEAENTGLLLQDPNDSVISGTIYREVAFGLENAGVPQPAMPKIVTNTLSDVGLDKSLNHPSRDLSGGEMQRMAFAGVIAASPDILLLDEPTSMLDSVAAKAVRESVATNIEINQSTLIVVEHRFEAWLPLVERLLVLNSRGELVHDGVPTEILETHGVQLAELGIWVPGLPAPTPKHVDLELGTRSRIIVLTGPSGAGKTTELKRRLKIDPLAATIVTGVGYVPQQPEITFIGNTVFESAHLTTKAAADGLGILPEDARARTHSLLDSLGVRHLEGRNPYQISSGEQRRVAMATALGHWPMAVYLDEPTMGQDRESWSEIVGAILAARAAGIRVTVATHDRDLIALADEIVEIQPTVPEESSRDEPIVSGLAALGASVILLLGSMAITSVAKGLGVLIVLAVSALVLAALKFSIRTPSVLFPALIGVLSIGLSNWYLGAQMDPEVGLVAALRVATFIIPGALLATQLRPISFGDQLSQWLRLPARPVIAAVAAMQKIGGIISLWDELRFIHFIRGLGSARNPRARLAEFSRLVFALLVQSIREAGTTSVAMDSRGFSRPFGGLDGRRTWAESPRTGRLDFLVLALSLVAAAIPLVVA